MITSKETRTGLEFLLKFIHSVAVLFLLMNRLSSKETLKISVEKNLNLLKELVAGWLIYP